MDRPCPATSLDNHHASHGYPCDEQLKLLPTEDAVFQDSAIEVNENDHHGNVEEAVALAAAYAFNGRDSRVLRRSEKDCSETIAVATLLR